MKTDLEKRRRNLPVWFLRASRDTKITFTIGLGVVILLVLLSGFPQLFSPKDPYFIVPNKLLHQPDTSNLFGTDSLGRDVLSRVIYGAGISISVAMVSVLLASVVGTFVGILSGYIGGKIDRVLAMPMDALYAFPSFITALLVAITLGPGIVNTGLAVAVSWIPTYYRVVRSITLSIKQQTFIEAEKALGASRLYVMFRHVFPSCSTSIVVLMSLGVASAIRSVAGLGFLGLGIQPPTPEWGTDLSTGRMNLGSGIWWTTTFPGMMIFLAVIGFNLLGDGLTGIFNPKFKRIGQ